MREFVIRLRNRQGFTVSRFVTFASCHAHAYRTARQRAQQIGHVDMEASYVGEV
jgi:hypothetical protein